MEIIIVIMNINQDINIAINMDINNIYIDINLMFFITNIRDTRMDLILVHKNVPLTKVQSLTKVC